MDWNPSFEQELQQIHKGHAHQQPPQEHEYGYQAQQPQVQQQYSSLSESHLQHVFTLPFGLRLAAALSYVFAWVTGFVFFLFAEKRNRFVRFHALQSLLFFGGISILGFIVGSFINFGMIHDGDFSFILFLPLVIAWIALILLILMAIAGWFMGIVNALRGRYYKMPFVGDFVERYINKQAIPK